MLEKLTYENHIGEVFEFGKDGIYVNASDLHDYEWAATTKGDRISALTRKVSTRSLPVIILCDTAAKGTAARNRLLEVTEKDVLAMEPGKIILGGYYFKCFVTKSSKGSYLINKRYMALTLTLASDHPYWVKESTFAFRVGGNSTSGASAYLDFSYDYPFDYASSVVADKVNNGGFVGSNFRLTIYGPCSNPAVYINGHKYQVNCDVAESEYLTIDSVTKKIYLTKNDGTIENKFGVRNKESYVFEKIPAGSNAVTWEGDFGFDVTTIEERSEPKWT